MIGLIDADFIPYFVCYNKQDEPEKTLEEAISSANSYLQGILNGTSVEEFNLFFTVGKNFRYEIYPEYKANRIGKEKPPFFDEVKNYLIQEYKGIHGYNLEADDLLVIYKNKLISENKDYIVVSTDKDINNLEGRHYNIKENLLVNIDKQFAAEYFWKSMITGDAADNIKCLPKKGPAYADKLFATIDADPNHFPIHILHEYIKHFGEEIGISEYYKNYKCLKILDKHEGIIFEKPVNVKEVTFKLFGNL